MKNLIGMLSRDGAPDTADATDATDANEQRARHVAEQICAGFQYHDRGQRADAIDAFYEVDRSQFAHLTDDDAREAARAYVEALWQKDSVEKQYTGDDGIDAESIAAADWSDVHRSFLERARIVGMDEAYADHTMTAWKRHKADEEYWTPLLRAQQIEYRAATGDSTYPEKPNDGQAGFGPAPVRYVLGVELHDLHRTEAWSEAIDVMVPYYRSILRAHRGGSPY